MNKYRDLERLKEIKILLKTGQISYDQAELQAKEYLDNINIKIAKISKRMKQKPKEKRKKGSGTFISNY